MELDQPVDDLGDVYFEGYVSLGKVEQKLWQPIDTAPKDGTKILLREDNRVDTGYWWPEEDGGVTSACWVVSVDTEAGWPQDTFWDPSHWMPLPEPPK